MEEAIHARDESYQRQVDELHQKVEYCVGRQPNLFYGVIK
jgi:hypothetical protein